MVGKGMEEFGVEGVTADNGKMLLTVELQRSTVCAAIWDRAAKAHLAVSTPMITEKWVRFFVDRESEDEWRKHLQELAALGFVDRYVLDTEIVPLSVIGNRFSQDGAGLQKVFEVLAHYGISVTIGTASALAITVAVPRHRIEEALQGLHKDLEIGGGTR